MKTPLDEKQPGLKPVSNFLRTANLCLIVSWFILSSACSVVAAPPEIVHPPRGQTVILYQQAAFGVIAAGTAPLSYQWRKDGVPIAGATYDQMVIAQSQFSDAGRYSVLVSNAEATATSAEAVLTVNPPQAGDVDFSFVWGGSINGTVGDVIVQPDGKILIGGEFTTVHRAGCGGIARLNSDGSTDHTFMNGLPGADGSVSSMALQTDGKVLIAGFFTSVNDVSRNGFARLNADGTLDSTYPSADFFTDGRIHSIVLQRDGKALIKRNLMFDGMAPGHDAIVRLNPDGTQDDFLIEIGRGWVHGVDAIAVHRDGKILLGGLFDSVNGVSRYGVARLNANGTLDGAFSQVTLGNGTDVGGFRVRDVEVEPDGKVVIEGSFTSVNGVRRNGLARLNPNGTLDTGFRPEISGGRVGLPTAARLALQGDGKVILLGNFTMVNGVPVTDVARLHSDGTLDVGFGHAALGGWYNHVPAVQRDGKVLVAGYSGIVRLNADATFDANFQNGFSGAYSRDTLRQISSVVSQSDGKVLIGGPFTTVDGVPRTGVARLQANGVLDSGFNVELSGEYLEVNTIALQPEGKALIGGRFTGVNGVPAGGIARINSDGTRDTDFQPAASDLRGVYSIIVQGDGKMLLARNYDLFQGIATSVERLNPDGAPDPEFHNWIAPGGGHAPWSTPWVTSLVLQNDGKVLVSGENILPSRLNTDGTLDSGFAAEASGSTIAVQADGKIIMGVGYSSCSSSSFPVSRLHGDGTLDAAFHAEVLGCGTIAIAVQRDGKVLIGGYFSAVNGESRTGIARLNADGTLDKSFQEGLAGTGGVRSFAFQQDGKILIAGDFSAVNGMPAAGIARLWGSADIPPRITSFNLNGAEATLSWDALPNRTYRVQYNDDLTAPWTDLAGNVSGSPTGTASKTDTTVANVPRRFYRVELLP